MIDKDFQVIHFSTGHDGGAGIAARRLNKALCNSGINSRFISLRNKDYYPNKFENEIRRNFFERFFSGITAKIQVKLSKKFFFSFYSFDVLSQKKLEKFISSSSTILHFHNWFNLVDQKKISKLLQLGYPVVMTLHDERFYTGGCHHAFDCNGFKDGCGNCPQVDKIFKIFPSSNLSKSVEQFKSRDELLQIIAPSMWIYKRAKESRLLSNHNVRFISNTLGDFGELKSNQKQNFPNLNNPKTIGVASMDFNSYLKGSDIIKNLQELFIENSLDFNLVFLSEERFKGKYQLNFWQVIDVLLVPSRADNSPNVIHEAKRYGIPVIATAVGGITELLDLNFDELIPIDQLSASVILGILKEWNTKNRKLHSTRMQHRFATYTSNSVNEHIDLYKSLLNQLLA
jgi:glycosyltransferase involved in cell wall biosynthesis